MMRRRLIRRGSSVAAESNDDLDRTGIVAASVPVRPSSDGDLRFLADCAAARHRKPQNNWWAGAVAAVALLLAGWVAGGLFGSPLGTHDAEHLAGREHLPSAPLSGAPVPPRDDASPTPQPSPPPDAPAAPPTAEATLVPAPQLRQQPAPKPRPTPTPAPRARAEQPSSGTGTPDVGQQLAEVLNQALREALGLPGVFPR